jgi:hypothetical protein
LEEAGDEDGTGDEEQDGSDRPASMPRRGGTHRVAFWISLAPVGALGLSARACHFDSF